MRHDKISQAVERQYMLLKTQVCELGLIRPGSLIERYMPCGKSGCRCMRNPPVLHGPYYQWTYKIQNKTVTKRLSKAQAKQCREWIRNRQQMKELMRRMEVLSLEETDRILSAISDP